MDIKKKVIGIIRKTVKNIKLSDDKLLKTDYISNGLVDSFQIIDIINEIEKEIGVGLTPDEMASDEFRTPEGIIKVVERLKRKK